MDAAHHDIDTTRSRALRVPRPVHRDDAHDEHGLHAVFLLTRRAARRGPPAPLITGC